jgi:hypothetical protein
MLSRSHPVLRRADVAVQPRVGTQTGRVKTGHVQKTDGQRPRAALSTRRVDHVTAAMSCCHDIGVIWGTLWVVFIGQDYVNFYFKA